MHLDLIPLWTLIIGFAVFMYVLLDGFDLGVGMLFALRDHAEDRETMMASIAPIWDFNETWLVLGGVGLMAIFPVAFAVMIPALYFPILGMLLGLVFRGVAFEFRGHGERASVLWGYGFVSGSFAATFMQGVVLGNFIQGFEVRDRVFVGSSWDWVSPFPLLCGLGLMFGYGLLGATWLVWRTDGELQAWARRMAVRALWGTVVFIALMSIWTPLVQPAIAQRWFSFPHLLWFSPVPLLTAAVTVLLLRSLRGDRDHLLPFLCSFGLFFLAYSGLIISLWPMIVPPSITLWDAAAGPKAQAFLMVGTLFMLPVLLMYVGWAYWIFRGKVKGSYHGAY